MSFHRHVGDRPRRRLLLAAIGFFPHLCRPALYLLRRLPQHRAAGAALTLDEFDLLLHLEQGVYWTARDSVDAVLLFGAALLIGIYGSGFVKALSCELWQSRHRRESPK